MKIFFVGKPNPYEWESGSLQAVDAKAAIKGCDYERKAEQLRGIELPSGMKLIVLDGWAGSFHEAYHYPERRGVFVYAERLAGGWMGRMRRAARMVQEAMDGIESAPRGDAVDAWAKGSMIHRGIIREEGD